jgi:hypothetical protein
VGEVAYVSRNEQIEWIVADRFVFEVLDKDRDGVAEKIVVRDVDMGETLAIQVTDGHTRKYVSIYVFAIREDLDNSPERVKLSNVFFMKAKYEDVMDLLEVDRLKKIRTIAEVEKYIRDVAVKLVNLIRRGVASGS